MNEDKLENHLKLTPFKEGEEHGILVEWVGDPPIIQPIPKENMLEWRELLSFPKKEAENQSLKEQVNYLEEMSFLDELTTDEPPCDYKKISKRFGNKIIRLRKQIRAARATGKIRSYII